MKKILPTFIIIIAAVGMASVLASCAKKSKDGITIGANIYTFADNFMNGVLRPELVSYAKKKDVTISIVDSEGDQAKLNDQVDVFISKGVDVLALNLVDPAAAHTIIEKAKAADIPLILFNKEATEKGVMQSYDKVWYVGTNSAESGIIQGKMMLADWQATPAWDKNGDNIVQYVMLKGEPGHPDAEARTKESVKVFTDAGVNVKELAIAASPQWSTSDANNTMESWLTSPFAKSIELVISNNDGMAFGAVQAMKSSGVSIPVYGVDALDQAISMIESGELNGTVLNDGINQAHATLDLAINAARGNNVVADTKWKIDNAITKAVRVPYRPVTQNNYADFKK